MRERKLLLLRRVCSDDNDFTRVSTRDVEMCGFLQKRGYLSELLREDLRKISNINRFDTLYSHIEESSQTGRVPLVLTNNGQIKKILLINFRIIKNGSESGWIFTDAPLVAYRRDCNIRNILVTPLMKVNPQIPQVPFLATIQDAVPVNMLAPQQMLTVLFVLSAQRKFQLSFYQLDLLHLAPSLLSSIQRGNRSNPPITFRRTPQKHREKNPLVSPLLSTSMD